MPNEKPIALTRERLEAVGCGTANCHHDHSVLFIHSRCHPSAPIEAAYEKADGVLTVRCYRCKAEVVRFQIATGATPPEVVVQ